MHTICMYLFVKYTSQKSIQFWLYIKSQIIINCNLETYYILIHLYINMFYAYLADSYILYDHYNEIEGTIE